MTVDFKPAAALVVLAALCLTLGAGSAARAQSATASQVTQPSYAPPVIRSVEGGLELPETIGLEVPEGAEKLEVTPSGLSVSGGRTELAADTAAIAARLTNRRVTGRDLFTAARDLEVAYARAGYILVRVSLPPQTIKDGMPLLLTVVDGYVEAIDTSNLPEGARGRVESILGGLVGRPGLIRADLERAMLLAGDTPGVLLRSTLQAGSKPGTTVLIVDGRYDPVTFSLSADNSLGSDLGTWTVTPGIDLNNILGMGEVGYLRLSGYPGFGRSVLDSDPRNRQLVAGATVPVGTDGLWVNLEGVDSRTHPTSDLPYSMLDHFQRLSVKGGYSWIRSRDMNTSTTISLDVTREEQRIDLKGVRSDFSKDDLRVLRLSQTADLFTASGGLLSGSVTASVGLDALGARQATAALPLSRDGAKPDFTKLEVSARFNQSVADDRMQFTLAAKVQTSFGSVLTSSEQMGLGGFDWLSAFESGGVQGDKGAVMRGELSLPLFFQPSANDNSLGGAVAPYAFAGIGIAEVERPTGVEPAVTRAAAYGVGARIGLSEKGSPHSATLALEYAHGDASGGGKAEDRLNARLLLRF